MNKVDFIIDCIFNGGIVTYVPEKNFASVFIQYSDSVDINERYFETSPVLINDLIMLKFLIPAKKLDIGFFVYDKDWDTSELDCLILQCLNIKTENDSEEIRQIKEFANKIRKEDKIIYIKYLIENKRIIRSLKLHYIDV